MKKSLVLSVIVLSLFVHRVFAEHGSDARPQDQSSVGQHCGEPSQTRSFVATGIVRKIDPDNGIVIIFHSPVAALMWPSMTMPFSVNDKALIDRFRVGDKVKFKFVRDAGSDVIVDMQSGWVNKI
jgi:Cu(I)/Ag(I) efflux system protein CusF